MNKKSLQSRAPEFKPQCLFAKFGNGGWYAILPGMETGLLKAGAEVCLMPENDAMEETTPLTAFGQKLPVIHG